MSRDDYPEILRKADRILKSLDELATNTHKRLLVCERVVQSKLLTKPYDQPSEI